MSHESDTSVEQKSGKETKASVQCAYVNVATKDEHETVGTQTILRLSMNTGRVLGSTICGHCAVCNVINAYQALKQHNEQ